MKEEKKEILNEWIVPAIGGLLALIGAGTVGGAYASSSHYKQNMIPNDKGFFNPDMMVGEFFEIEEFTGNEQPWELMDLFGFEKSTGFKSYSDEYGTYLKIKGSSDSESTDLRVYLPKKEWFDQFKGKIRTIRDSEGVGSEKRNTYGLCFYLQTPKNAIKTKLVRPDGSVYFGPPQNMYDAETKTYTDDPSRGWAVLDTYKQSGYFKMGGDVISQDIVEQTVIGAPNYGMVGDDVPNLATSGPDPIKSKLSGIGTQLDNLMKNPPSGLQEYTWGNYSDKYSRTEFDRWYDSSNGTWIVIGTQICAAVATGGIASWATAAIESTALATTANIGIQVAGELIAGGWEAVYLYNRGLNSQAALVAFCCFLPVFTESAFFGKLIGKPPGFDDAIGELTREFKVGGMRCPADFKRWMKGLDPELRKTLQDRIEVIAPLYMQKGTSDVIQQIKKGFNEAIAELKRGSDLKIKGGDLAFLNDVSLLFKNPELLKNPKIQKYIKGIGDLNVLKQQAESVITKSKGTFWKGLGLNLSAVGGVFALCAFALKDNEEFKKDPQGILTGAEKEILSFRQMSEKNAKIFENKILKLNEEIKNASNPETQDIDLAFAKTKELIQLLLDLNFLSKTNDWKQKLAYHKFIEQFRKSTFNELQRSYYNNVSNGNIQKANDDIEKLKRIDNEKSVNVADSFTDGAPKSYLKVSNGYTDSTGSLITVTNENFVSFIEWFCGYNILNGTITNLNPYQKTNNITFIASFFSKNYEGVITEYPFNFPTSEHLVNRIKTFFQQDKRYDFNNINAKYYWGNVYFLRKIFTDYYDDYLISKGNITTTSTTTINKQ